MEQPTEGLSVGEVLDLLGEEIIKTRRLLEARQAEARTSSSEATTNHPADDTLEERMLANGLARMFEDSLVVMNWRKAELVRLDPNSRVLCVSCNTPIEAERLRSKPHASLCCECMGRRGA